MKQGWKIMKLGEVCKVIAGQSPRGNAYNDKGVGVEFHQGKKAFGKDVIQPSGVWTTEITKMAEAGDILMSVRAPVGPTNFTDRSVCIGRGLAAIRCSELVLPQFILYALKNIENKIVGKDGAVFNSISKDMIEDLPVPKLSLSEQQRIVALLDAEFAKIDALKANAEKNLQNAKDLFQAALKKELEPKEGWKKKTIKDVCSVFGRIGYRGYTRNDLVDNAVDGAITLSPSNIVDNEMVYDKVTYISWFKYEESPEIMIFDDDILLVKTGSSYGKCALVRNLPHKATINPQFVVLKNININRRFLNYYLRTPYSKARFDEFVSGTAIPTFSQANLGNMTITFPSMEDQQSIVSRLDTLNEKCKALQANYEKTLSLCDDLKQALLRKAFNGEI